MSWLRGVAGDGWAGALSVPWVLGLESDRLLADPHPSVAGLFRDGVLEDAGIIESVWRR